MSGAQHFTATLFGNRKDQALKYNSMPIKFGYQVSYKANRYKNSNRNTWKYTAARVISKAKFIS
jgi:hypothetical protein